MAQVNAGRVRFVSRGEYNNSTQYYLFDLVDYNGSSYFAKANTTGNDPTNTTYWQLVAEKGNTGGDGPVGPTGNGIASIVKTASAGLIDTYTITFTDGTTSTFNITNGADGEVTQEYVDEENERLKSVFNVLPKVSGSGESIELENTGDTMLYKMDLKGNTSQDVVQGEVGLEEEDTSIYVDDVDTDKENYITLKGNTYQETTTGKNLYNATISAQTSYSLVHSGDNRYLYMNGTPSGNHSINWRENSLPAGTYKIMLQLVKGTFTSTTNGGLFYVYGDNVTTSPTNIVLSPSNPKVSATINVASDTTNLRINSWARSTETYNNAVIAYQIVEGSTDDYDFEPYTNGASPNPNYPQEIEVVTGLNEVEIEAKNLFDKNSTTSGFIRANGEIVSPDSNWVYIFRRIKPNTQYVISGISTTNNSVGINNYDKNRNFIRNAIDYRNGTFTTDSSAFYLGISVRVVDVDSFQLEIGSTATTYEAYQGQTYEVNLGKNLFDISKVINGTWNNPESTTRIILYLDKVKKGTTISVTNNGTSGYRFATGFTRLGYPDTSNVMVNESGYITSSTYTITADNDGYPFLQITKLNNTIINPSEVTGLFQIEKSDTPTSYAPYFTPIELCKIGTYQDRIYKSLVDGNWYLHKEIGKYTFTGNEDVMNFGDSTYEFRITTNLSNIKDGTANIYCLCDKLVCSTGNSMWNKKNTAGYNLISAGPLSSNFLVILNDITTSSGISSALSTLKPVIYYVLSTPTDTQITDTTLVNQLNALYNAQIHSTTHINTETSNLLPYINLKYNVVTASPSPDRASEVEVVKGNNTITISNEDGTKTQTYNITLGNLELCKIGDYQDYFYKDNGNWYKYGAIGKVVLDGTNVVFTYQDQNVYPNALMIPYSSRPRGLGDTSSVICSHFSNIATNVGTTLNTLYWSASSQMWICKEGFTSLNNGNTWLQTQYNNGTPVIVYYALETPTTTEITNSTLIAQLNELKKAMSYYDKTLITQTNADKPFILDVIGIRDLQDIFNLISSE